MSWTDPCKECGNHRADCECKLEIKIKEKEKIYEPDYFKCKKCNNTGYYYDEVAKYICTH